MNNDFVQISNLVHELLVHLVLVHKGLLEISHLIVYWTDFLIHDMIQNLLELKHFVNILLLILVDLLHLVL